MLHVLTVVAIPSAVGNYGDKGQGVELSKAFKLSDAKHSTQGAYEHGECHQATETWHNMVQEQIPHGITRNSTCHADYML